MNDEPATRRYTPQALARLLQNDARTRVLRKPPPLPSPDGAAREPRQQRRAAGAAPQETVVLSAPRAERAARPRVPSRRLVLIALALAVAAAAGVWYAKGPRSERGVVAASEAEAEAEAEVVAETETETETETDADPDPDPDPEAEAEAETVPVPSASRRVAPAEAIARLKAGQYAAALRNYRALRREHPERAVYGVVVSILERRLAERCRQTAQGDPACAPPR